MEKFTKAKYRPETGTQRNDLANRKRLEADKWNTDETHKGNRE